MRAHRRPSWFVRIPGGNLPGGTAMMVAAAAPSVLVIEDDRDTRECIVELLEERG
jgi:hypothetical protein